MPVELLKKCDIAYNADLFIYVEINFKPLNRM